MTVDEHPHCAICGKMASEVIQIASVGSICPQCLMGGRFLGGSSLRLAVAATRLSEMSRTVRDILSSSVEEAENLARQNDFDRARHCFLQLADQYLDAGHPLLAAHVLTRALRLPGQSASVYEALGRAARAMDCRREALQHFKTAGWLALKSRNPGVAEKVAAALLELAPNDAWHKKNREQLARLGEVEDSRCQFCGRTASEAGPLIEGSEAAVCAACVKRMMSLDTRSH